jgi:hypothetical protein
MSYRFKQTKELGAGDKVCINSPSHRCVLVDNYLSPRVLGEVLELLSGARQVVYPKESLLFGGSFDSLS